MELAPSNPRPPQGGAPAAFPPRLPPLMILLAVVCIGVGLFSAFLSMADLSAMLTDRDLSIEAYRDRALLTYDRKLLPEPFSRLPRTEVSRLALRLGEDRYERRGVNIPLSLLNLLLCWVLCTGAMGALKRRDFALPMWIWACMANVPLCALSLSVTFILSREVMTHLSSDAAAALSAVSKRPPEIERQAVWMAIRLYLTTRALVDAGWALFLGATALYLQRRLPHPAPAR